jgi:hypothetical protein
VPLHVELVYARRMSQVVPSVRARSIDDERTVSGRVWRSLGVLLVTAALGLALHHGWLVCPIAALLSVPCPGCGLTRAALLLAAGDWNGAVRMHPLAPLLVPLVVLAALRAAHDYIVGSGVPGTGPCRRRIDLDPPRFAPWGAHAAAVVAVAVIVVWALRFRGAFGGPVPLELLLDR